MNNNEIQIDGYFIRALPGGILQIDNPEAQKVVSQVPGYFMEAVGFMALNGSQKILKTKSNNKWLDGKRFRFTDKKITAGEFVVPNTASKKGYGYLHYVTKMNNNGIHGTYSESFIDDGKISSLGDSPRCYSKNYQVIEFIDPIDTWN